LASDELPRTATIIAGLPHPSSALAVPAGTIVVAVKLELDHGSRSVALLPRSAFINRSVAAR